MRKSAARPISWNDFGLLLWILTLFVVCHLMPHYWTHPFTTIRACHSKSFSKSQIINQTRSNIEAISRTSSFATLMTLPVSRNPVEWGSSHRPDNLVWQPVGLLMRWFIPLRTVLTCLSLRRRPRSQQHRVDGTATLHFWHERESRQQNKKKKGGFELHVQTHLWRKRKETATLSITLKSQGCARIWQEFCHLQEGGVASEAIGSLFSYSPEKTATSKQAQIHLLSIQCYIRAGSLFLMDSFGSLHTTVHMDGFARLMQ